MTKSITKTESEKFIYPPIKAKENGKKKSIRVRIWNNTTTVAYDTGDQVQFIVNGIGKRMFFKTVTTFKLSPSIWVPAGTEKTDIAKFKNINAFSTEFHRITGQDFAF